MSIVDAWFIQRFQRARRADSAKKRAQPGWYYDPRKQARYRYWDGARWTDDVAEQIPAEDAS